MDITAIISITDVNQAHGNHVIEVTTKEGMSYQITITPEALLHLLDASVALINYEPPIDED